MLTKEQQRKNVDVFTADLINAVQNEGLAQAIPQTQQVMTQQAISSIGDAVKTVVGEVSPICMATSLVLYGQAMIDAMQQAAMDGPVEGGRQVFQHVDEQVGTVEGDEDDDDGQ